MLAERVRQRRPAVGCPRLAQPDLGGEALPVGGDEADEADGHVERLRGEADETVELGALRCLAEEAAGGESTQPRFAGEGGSTHALMPCLGIEVPDTGLLGWTVTGAALCRAPAVIPATRATAGLPDSANRAGPWDNRVMGLVNVLIAIAIGFVVWRLSIAAVRMLSTPPPEVDPDDIEETVQDYKCTVCGAEVIMTVKNVSTEAAPRHCREDMVPVWRPD